MFRKTIIELKHVHTSNWHQDLLVPVIDSVQSYRLSSATEVSKSFDLLNFRNATSKTRLILCAYRYVILVLDKHLACFRISKCSVILEFPLADGLAI